MQEFIKIQEVYKDDGKYLKKYFTNLRYNWNILHDTIFSKSKEKGSSINTALEGGKRLARREKNMLTAFTYGRKFKYQDIDDPFFVYNVIN